MNDEDVVGYVLANGTNGIIDIDLLGEEYVVVGQTKYEPEVRNEEGEVVSPEKLKHPITEKHKIRYYRISVCREDLGKVEEDEKSEDIETTECDNEKENEAIVDLEVERKDETV